MPRLLMFVPCERVIIGQGDNSLSLINVLQNIQVNRPSAGLTEIPANAAIPMQWAIVTVWLKEREDEGIGYTQRVALISPTERILIESITGFAMEKEAHRIANNIVGFPIGESGPHVLKLWLRAGESRDWREIASFPVVIAHPAMTPASTRTQ